MRNQRMSLQLRNREKPEEQEAGEVENSTTQLERQMLLGSAPYYPSRYALIFTPTLVKAAT